MAAGKLPEIDVDAVVQNDLRSRGAVDWAPVVEDSILSTEASLGWAEDKVGHKLSKPGESKPKSLADAYNPDEAPEYTAPKDLQEDEDTASTL
jgi:hypothetical protein